MRGGTKWDGTKNNSCSRPSRTFVGGIPILGKRERGRTFEKKGEHQHQGKKRKVKREKRGGGKVTIELDTSKNIRWSGEKGSNLRKEGG